MALYCCAAHVHALDAQYTWCSLHSTVTCKSPSRGFSFPYRSPMIDLHSAISKRDSLYLQRHLRYVQRQHPRDGCGGRTTRSTLIKTSVTWLLHASALSYSKIEIYHVRLSQIASDLPLPQLRSTIPTLGWVLRALSDIRASLAGQGPRRRKTPLQSLVRVHCITMVTTVVLIRLWYKLWSTRCVL